MDFLQTLENNLDESQKLLKSCMQDEAFKASAVKLAELAIGCYKAGGKVLACGNGGSHCDAMHLCEELTGRYRKDRRPLGALALGEASHVTCVGNDYGFEHIFSRQVEGLGTKGDLLIGITTSGNSANVINAVKVAKEKHLKVAVLTGKGGGLIKDMVDVSIIVPSDVTDRIQEVHIKLIHILIQNIERHFFPENY